MKREAHTLTFIDLFAGVGGITEGFCKALLPKDWGLQPVLLVDHDADAITTFKRNRPSVPYLWADIGKLDEKTLRKNALLNGGAELDFLVGGPPCQGFSALTANRSDRIINDPRNRLMKEFLRFVGLLKPIFVLIENVPNAASYAKGKFIVEIREELEKMGYSSNMQVVIAHDYGVPQLRKRLLIAAVQNKYAADVPLDFPPLRYKKLPFAKDILEEVALDDFGTILTPYISVEDAIGDLPRIEAGQEATGYAAAPFTDYQASRRQRAKILCNHVARSHGEDFLIKINKIEEGSSNKDLPKNSRFDRKRDQEYFSQAYGRLHRDGIAQTITAHFLNPGSGRFLHYESNRAITVREAARFQSFDDDFVFYGKMDTQQKHVGNAVPPLLAKVFAEHFGERVLAAKRKRQSNA
ncbi:MAG: DNA cytosine methyltransferase [Patescibacteria group bacterium]|nr:DNA cytosine methyltransferase [Patescibacteria group bacterium]MDE2015046.1 DNA cytosine methyltransferase [Patescibacteria group bacterium]MDE2226474.1 DNA cytosine methyltransferase [Patescibacteria group bacterium]